MLHLGRGEMPGRDWWSSSACRGSTSFDVYSQCEYGQAIGGMWSLRCVPWYKTFHILKNVHYEHTLHSYSDVSLLKSAGCGVANPA